MLHINILLIIHLVTLPSVLTTYYRVDDRMKQEDKDKVVRLAYELLVEVKYKIDQTQGIRDQVSKMIGFEIGMIMGQIKEKYKSMLEIYRQSKNKYFKISKILTPAIKHRYKHERLPIHYFVRMEIIFGLEVDIDRLIHILETIPEWKLEMQSFG